LQAKLAAIASIASSVRALAGVCQVIAVDDLLAQ